MKSPEEASNAFGRLLMRKHILDGDTEELANVVAEFEAAIRADREARRGEAMTALSTPGEVAAKRWKTLERAGTHSKFVTLADLTELIRADREAHAETIHEHYRELERQRITAAEEGARRHGYEPRQLQLRWRTDPPLLADEKPNELLDAIVDALSHEGIPAWPGDATSCVEQIVRAVAKHECEAHARAPSSTNAIEAATSFLLQCRADLEAANQRQGSFAVTITAGERWPVETSKLAAAFDAFAVAALRRHRGVEDKA